MIALRRRRRNKPEIEEKLREHSLWRASYFREGSRADFSGWNLSGADFQGQDLSGARFRRANLRNTYLVDTVFHGSNFQGADLTGAVMFDTVFRRVDLSEVRGLEYVVHHGPSTIGLDTLLRSAGCIPPAFLQGAGLPLEAIQPLLEWAREHGGSTKYYSVFISYGGPDEAFALRLYDALRARGVEVFIFARHAQPGMKLYEVMSRYVNEYERVLLICSRDSLVRPGVANELDEVLRREAREGGSSVLLPVALDDYVFSQWTPVEETLARAVRDRVVGDFRGAIESNSVFSLQFERLMSALRRAPEKLRHRAAQPGASSGRDILEGR